MKQKLLLLLFTVIFISCSDDDTASPDLLGTWQLAEVLVDPGDGSGVFMPVESANKTITFLSDGEVTSNGSLCSLFANDGGGGSGIYSLQDSTISPICAEYRLNTDISFWIEGSNLILGYLCIEPCAEKYIKQ